MNRAGAPLRFMVAVLGLWCVGRASALWLERPVGSGNATSVHATRVVYPRIIADASVALATLVEAVRPSSWFPGRARRSISIALTPAAPPMPAKVTMSAARKEVDVSQVGADDFAPAPRLSLLLPAPYGGVETRASRWSGTAWLFARGNGDRVGLASAGQLGGGQAGAILRWRINDGEHLRSALYARATTPLADRRGSEAAIGTEWHPLPGVPFWIAAERRIALGEHGRNAFAAYAAGGFWTSNLPGALIADGYGQAGIVGLHRRDMFADGAFRLAKPLGKADGPRLGGGLWGAAQPGVARLDLGPHLAVPLKLGKQPVSLSADWRLRVAGKAEPGSGLAVTLGTDF